MIATVEDGRVTKLVGDEHHPVTQGQICSRGRRILDRTYSPDRVLIPKKRVNGEWQSISWERAISEIAAEIQHTMDNYGHHSILHSYDWGSGTLLKNLNQRFFYKLGGCTETVGSLCWDAGLAAQTYDFGQARSHSPFDLKNAKRIVVWGRNLPVTNMHMVPFVRQAMANGTELAVINPLPTDLDRTSQLVVRPRPGTDGALALGILRVCRDNGWIDNGFLEQHSIGFEDLSAYLDTFTMEFVSKETDVSPYEIEQLARWYGTQGPVATLLGLGMQRYAGGGNTVRAIDALAAATGHIGVPGGGVNYANRQMTAFLDEEALAARTGRDVREFVRGTQANEILKADPPIQMMFVSRTNPVSQVPNTQTLIEAYRQIPTIVVIDTMMTATAELADYFLPCTTVLEEEDISLSTMWHPYITYAHQAVSPRGEAKPDYEIFSLLADKLGFGEDMRRPLTDWFELALRPLAVHGIDLATLQQRGTVRLPLPLVPFADRVFSTPSGKVEFVSARAAEDGVASRVTYVRPWEADNAGRGTELSFPYALITAHPRTSENSQHKAWPNLPEEPTAEISEAIARETGLATGQKARLETRYGQLQVVIRVQTSGHPRTVRVESGWASEGRTINHLTSAQKADLGQQTSQYDVACRLVAEK